MCADSSGGKGLFLGVFFLVSVSNDGGTVYDVRVEDGRLFYENRCFHKGQQVFVESKEHGQERWVCQGCSLCFSTRLTLSYNK